MPIKQEVPDKSPPPEKFILRIPKLLQKKSQENLTVVAANSSNNNVVPRSKLTELKESFSKIQNDFDQMAQDVKLISKKLEDGNLNIIAMLEKNSEMLETLLAAFL